MFSISYFGISKMKFLFICVIFLISFHSVHLNITSNSFNPLNCESNTEKEIKCTNFSYDAEPQVLSRDFLSHLDITFKVTYVYIWNNIYKIDSDWTADLNKSELRWTTFSLSTSNSLKELDVRVFSSLLNLEHLILQNTMVGTLPFEIFYYNSKLITLELESNSLKTIDARIFRRAKNLKYLNLNRNELEILPLGLFTPTNKLQILNLSDNKLTNLEPGIFNNMPELSSIMFNRNPLLRLSPGIFNELPALTDLSFSGCKLNEIDVNSFRGLSNLKVIFLDANNLSEIPEAVFQDMRKIEKIFLYDNKFQMLPENLFNQLNKLTNLDLSKNFLNQIPTINAQNLTFLSLGYNYIENLELNQITKLPLSLEYLVLNYNKLTYLNIDVINYLDNVKKIGTKGNPWYCPCLNFIETKRINHTEDNEPPNKFNDNSMFFKPDVTPKCINYLFADAIYDWCSP